MGPNMRKFWKKNGQGFRPRAAHPVKIIGLQCKVERLQWMVVGRQKATMHLTLHSKECSQICTLFHLISKKVSNFLLIVANYQDFVEMLRSTTCIRPSKKINMFHVRILEKYQEESIFIFWGEMALNTHIKHDIWRIQCEE